jgi:hypothetical protein
MHPTMTTLRALADIPNAPDTDGHVTKYLKDLCHQVEADLVWYNDPLE